MGIIKKIITLNYHELFPLFKQAKKISGKSYFYILKDLLSCYKQGYSWSDYFAFKFASNPDPIYRESFISVGRHYHKISKAFPTEAADNLFFDDKGEFNRNFREFRKIDAIDLRVDSYQDFVSFLQKHQDFFAKEAISCGGYGVKYFDKKTVSQTAQETLYNQLRKDNLMIIEERIIQHPELAKLSLHSLNSLRIVTVKHKNGSISVPFVVSKISISDAMVDNASSGGAYALVNEEGKIYADYHRFLPVLSYFKENPITKFTYIGFRFPYYQEAKKLCIEASKRCKNHYIGWDVAIREDGPVLIEANTAPGAQLIQPVNQLINGKGHLSILEDAFGIQLR